MTDSMKGSSDHRPCFQQSYARSIVSIEPTKPCPPRFMYRLSATLLNLGKPDKAIFTFPEDPLILKFFAFSYIPGGKSFLSIHLVKVRFASILDTTIPAYNSSPFSNTTPVALPFLTRIFSTPELVRISPP